ncbi:hypothetical protein [Micromonospora peucetia]|uniref:Uncharacterized protein n=1 Tax=Micromonospora peucetia TaxID=47871 RepID=A0ABZ1EJX3_9ACTN|nr:hypothetical protein [Micromonospora peucetia]WSA34520.1 hypothetical protein OIE14_11000 [Micromonospora peucetia]
MSPHDVLAAHIRDSLAAGREPDDIEQWIADLGNPDKATRPDDTNPREEQQ